MATIVKMPQLGESVVEGTVVRWLKAPGETVDKLEPLLEIATDKIDTEIPSPVAGTLLTISAAEGATIAVGGALAYIGAPGEQIDSGIVDSGTVGSGTVGSGAVGSGAMGSGIVDSGTVGSGAADSGAVGSGVVGGERGVKPSGREFVSPVVARIAREHDIDLNAVTGSGLGGRVTKKDILAFVARQDTQATTPQRATATGSATEATTPRVAQVAQRQVAPVEASADEIVQPLSAMRRAIAQHMVLSKQTSPHVTSVYEVDATAIVRHREANRQLFAERGITLTYTPYFVAAVAAALREVPIVNSRFTETGIVTRRRVHIGVAVALAEGLIVPVIRDADEKNLQGLARAVNGLASEARGGRLAADATHGGTFTITNHGVTGSLLGTPIINQPQSGILGIGTIAKRAVVRSASASLLPSADDAIVIRPICFLSFSFDHRVLDGATADRFMAAVKAYLENYPATEA